MRLNGVVGDRLVHVREPSGRVVTSRYRPGLLGLRATLGDNGEPLIEGRPWDDPASLAAVRVASAPDVELVPYSEPDRGQRHDILPLTVLTDGMVSAIGVDYRRFRPNILVAGADGLSERKWAGRALRVGSTLIAALRARPRCVMTTYDPDSLEQDPTILQRIVRDFDGTIALDCWILEPGRIQLGDRVDVVDLPSGVDLPRLNNAR